jgi:hypothetical protein
MYLKELFNVLPRFFDANIPVEIGSPPGVGKSEVADQVGAMLSKRDGFQWGISKCFIATLAPVDINGYLVPGRMQTRNEETGNIEEVRISEFTVPSYMISTEGKLMNSYKRGLVIFEEWDKGDPDVKKASAEVILNGRCGQHILHSGIARMALVNRLQDRSGSTKNFDFIINRRGELTVTAELSGWNEWALAAGIDPLFVAFADRNPQVVFSNELPETQMPFCTPRSFVRLSKLLPSFTDDKGKMIHDQTTTEVASGMIGVAAATKMMQWVLMRNEAPDFDDVIDDPTGCQVPDRPDAKLMVCYELAHKVDEKTMGKVITYVQRYPADFAVTFVKAATRRNYDFINVSAMDKWVTKNASLLNAIGGAR